MIVWMLTGFWHGADWNFMLWGGFFGIILLIEKFFLAKLLDKAAKPLRHVYVMLIIFVSWAFFDAGNFGEAFMVIGRMFGVGTSSLAERESLYYLRSYAVPLIVGIIGSTPLLKRFAEKLMENSADSGTKQVLTTILEPFVLLLILVAATAKMIDGSFNPFIYFRS